MGQKDITEKNFVAYNDVFADIVNALIFNGEQVVHEHDLEDVAARSAQKINGKYKEIERDVVKKWRNGDVRIACLGIENQTSVDAKMPLRVISYDAAEYRKQYDDKSVKRGYPVLTLVLYFGYEKHWDKPLTLKQDLDGEPKDMCKFIDDTLAQGRAEGLEQGIRQESLRSRIATAKNLLAMGMDNAFIAKALGISEEEVPQLLQ